jgi:hypothetical protein
MYYIRFVKLIYDTKKDVVVFFDRIYKLKNKFFDFKLGDNILIEYDGDYWHSKPCHIENDKIKTKLAIENNYILIRIKDSESKNLEILNKIYNLWKQK